MGTKESPLLLFLCLLQTLFITRIYAEENEKFECDGGHFNAGENASITCNFRKDVSELENYHYYVEWYPFDRPDVHDGIEVLACFRIESGKLVCREKEGFHLNGSITDGLTLVIPNVMTKHAGRYSCQYVPPDGKRVVLCSLTVQGVRSTTPTTQDPGTTIASPKTDRKTDAATGPENPVNAVTAALSAISVAFVVGLCIVLYIRRRRAKKQLRQPYEGLDIEDPCNSEEAPMNVLKNWWNLLPSPVRTALTAKGFDNHLALKKMTEKHIKDLGLEKGHTLTLKQNLKDLKKMRAKANGRTLSDVHAKSVAVQYNADSSSVSYAESTPHVESGSGIDDHNDTGKDVDAKNLAVQYNADSSSVSCAESTPHVESGSGIDVDVDSGKEVQTHLLNEKEP